MNRDDEEIGMAHETVKSPENQSQFSNNGAVLVRQN